MVKEDGSAGVWGCPNCNHVHHEVAPVLNPVTLDGQTYMVPQGVVDYLDKQQKAIGDLAEAVFNGAAAIRLIAAFQLAVSNHNEITERQARAALLTFSSKSR